VGYFFDKGKRKFSNFLNNNLPESMKSLGATKPASFQVAYAKMALVTKAGYQIVYVLYF